MGRNEVRARRSAIAWGPRLGELRKRWLAERGEEWSQVRVAKALRITAGALSRYEHGSRSVPTWYIEDFAKLANLGVDELLVLLLPRRKREAA